MHSLMVCACLLLQTASTQTDWSSGSGVVGPVTSFGSRFYTGDSVAFATVGQIYPVMTSTSVLHDWTEHVVQDTSPIEGHQPLLPGDFDGDGDYDLAGSIVGRNVIRLYQNQLIETGVDTFVRHTDLSVTITRYQSGWVGDFDNDGRVDVVTARDSVFLFHNDGGWSFTKTLLGRTYRRGDTNYIDVGDMDNDGDKDIVFCTRPLLLLRNNGGGTFARESISPGRWWRVSLGDFNGDTYLDILNADQVYLNAGASNPGHFPGTPSWSAGFDPRDVDGHGVADFNSDGKVDLLIANQRGSSPAMYWYENDGTGVNYTQHTIISGGSVQYYGDACIAEDMDLDGRPDVVGGYSRIGYFHQNEDHTFTEIVVDSTFDGCHWVYVKNLGYRPNGTKFTLDIMATGTDMFHWWENGIVATYSEHGRFTSSILDAGAGSTWSWFWWDAVRPAGTELDFYLRTGSTAAQCTLNTWQGPFSVVTGTEIDSMSLTPYTTPGDRYFQYRAFMAGYNEETPSLNPVVYEVRVVYDNAVHDVGATAILAPVGTLDSGTVVTPQAVVYNYGNVSETFPVTFRIGSVYDQTVTGVTLTPGQTDTVDFPGWTAQPVGGHGTMAFTYLAGDIHPENDTVTGELEVVYPERHDVGATAILAPVGTPDSGTVITPRAVVHNFQTRTETFPVTFRIGSVYDQTVTGITLTPGQTDTVDFPNWTAQPVGSYTTMAFTDLTGDQNRSNDTVWNELEVLYPERHDVGATMILAPVGTVDSGTVVTPRAVVHNFQTRTETFPVTFRIGSVYDQTVTGVTLTPGQTDTIDFPNWIAQPIGGYGTMAFTLLNGDENTSNDTVWDEFEVGYPARHDVGATMILAPVGTVDSGTVITPRAVVYNFQTRTETFPVTFRIGSVYDQTVTGVTLTPGQTDTVDFPNWVAQPVGGYGTMAFTYLTGDQNRSNDTVQSSVTVQLPPRHDVGATMILAPVGTVDSGTVITPRAVVYNFQTRTETFPVTFRIGSVYDQTVTGITLVPGQTDTVDFPSWVAQPLGPHATMAFTYLTGDQNRSNDTVRSSVTVQLPPRHDVGATMILAPVGTVDSGTVITPRAVVYNFQTRTETFPVTFRIGSVYDQTVTGITLTPGQTDTVDFPNWVAQPLGPHATMAFTNLTGDENRSNDTVRSSVTVQLPPRFDVGTIAILAPVGTIDSGTVITPRAVVYNFGTRNATFPSTFQIGSVYNQTVPGITLTPGQTDTVDFPNWVAQPVGSHNVVSFTSLSNDVRRSNDTVRTTITVQYPPRHDVGATAILAPVGQVDSGWVITPRAVIYNYGTRNEVFPLTFRIGSVYDQTIGGLTLTPGQTDTIDFPDWVVQPVGVHTTMAFTYLEGDEHPENDTVTNQVEVLYPERHDVGATMILAPVGTPDSGTVITPRAVVYNYGTRNEAFPVTFRIGSVYDQTVPGIALTPGQTDTVDFPDWVVQPVGVHTTMAFTFLDGDEHPENDTVFGQVEVLYPERHDVGATMILAPVGTPDSGTVITPRAVVYNYGTRNEAFPVTFRIGSAYDQTVPGIVLTPGQTDTVDFPDWVAQPVGVHTTTAFTYLEGDEHPENDTVTNQVEVLYPERHDVGATAILAPVGQVDSGWVITPQAVIYNYGTRDEVFPLTFRVGSVYDQTIGGLTLTPGQTDTVDFPDWVAQPIGVHTTMAFTYLDGDEHPENDTVTNQAEVLYPERHDVGAVTILAPVGTPDSGWVITPQAVVYNYGTRDEVFPVTFRIGSVYDELVPGIALTPGQTDTVDFPDWVAQPVGVHTTMAFTYLEGDEHPENDTVTNQVEVLYPERHDVGATAILAPVGILDSGTVVTPRATIENFGTRTENFPVTFAIGSIYMETVQRTLTPGQTEEVSFPDWIAQPLGHYGTICYTALNIDENRSNDTVWCSVSDSVIVIKPERHDVGATMILAPTSQVDSGTVVTPQAVIYNFGTRAEAEFPVTFEIGSGYSQTLTASLAVGETDTVDFPAWEARPIGLLPTVCYTSLADDLDRSNDTARSEVQVMLVSDIGTEEVLAPVGTIRLDEGILKTTVSPKARIANYGQVTEFEFEVRFRIDSVDVHNDSAVLGTAYEQTVVVSSLAPGEKLEVSFPDAVLELGNYAVSCSTRLLVDANPANDKDERPCKVAAYAASDRDGRFEVVVYTRAGERVRSVDRNIRTGDPLLVQWDGLNDRGNLCAPGIYLCLLRFDPTDGAVEHQTQKLLVTTDFTGMVLTWR